VSAGEGLVLRDLAAGDAVPLACLHARCFERPWGASALARLLAVPAVGGQALFEAQSGVPAAFNLWSAAGGWAEILTFCVAPDRRRQGLGRALLRAGIERLAASGTFDLQLEAAAGNAAARALYEGAGFVHVGRRPGYYAGAVGAREDALIYALSLAGEQG